MSSSRRVLLEKLDAATTRAANIAINRGFPIPVSKNITLISSSFVEKNKNGLYNILSPNKILVYENIYTFDIAVIIAQRYNSGETSAIRKVLALEETYSKHHNDMMNYLSCLHIAKKKHDQERMAILEDKFQIAEISAKHARDSIAIYKRMR